MPLLADHAAASPSPRSGSSCRRPMRCSTAGSLRASATLAFFMPGARRRRSAQPFRPDNARPGQHHVGRLIQRRSRTMASPTLLIQPVPIDLAGLVLLRRQADAAPRPRDRANRPGVVDRDVNVIATRAPTPASSSADGTPSSGAPCAASPVQTWYSARSASRARSIGSVTRSSIAWPATSSRMRRREPALARSTPTFSPKPRRMPRMAQLDIPQLLTSSLRPASSARISCGWRATQDRSIPAHPHQLRHPRASLRWSSPSSLTRRFDAGGSRCRLALQPGLDQPGVQPLATGSRLHPDPRTAQAALAEESEPAPRVHSPPWLRGRSVRRASTTHTLLYSSETSIPA